MSLERIEQARRDAVMARRRLDSIVGALQHRLRPGNLAGEAWDGVKDKSSDLADGALTAARKRPALVSAAIGALALFLAREPLKRAVSRFVSDGDENEENGLVMTRIETDDAQFIVSATAADAALTKGVS